MGREEQSTVWFYALDSCAAFQAAFCVEIRGADVCLEPSAGPPELQYLIYLLNYLLENVFGRGRRGGLCYPANGLSGVSFVPTSQPLL